MDKEKNVPDMAWGHLVKFLEKKILPYSIYWNKILYVLNNVFMFLKKLKHKILEYNLKVNIIKCLGAVREQTGSEKYSFKLKFNKSKT